LIDAPALAFEAELRFMEASAVGAHQDHVGNDLKFICRHVSPRTIAGIAWESIRDDGIRFDDFRLVGEDVFGEFYLNANGIPWEWGRLYARLAKALVLLHPAESGASDSD